MVEMILHVIKPRRTRGFGKWINTYTGFGKNRRRVKRFISVQLYIVEDEPLEAQHQLDLEDVLTRQLIADVERTRCN
jgi:hypothetical protein